MQKDPHSSMASLDHKMIFILLVLTAALAGSGAVPAGLLVSEYRGTCDASAAVAMGNDHFIVANDEDNILRIYRLGVPDPVKEYGLDGFAKADPDHPEMDIEGAARIGNRVFWITSHGANKSAKYRESRRRFLATEFELESGRPKVTPVGIAYTDLLDDLEQSKNLKNYHLADAAKLAPNDDGGLNIEGLADTADGTLLIGFRNPLPRGNALIVTLNNPEDVILGRKPQIGPEIELPLGGLGIRSLERVGGGYLIVAGPRNGKGVSRLFRWQGPRAAPKPTPVATVNFEGLNPEALFAMPNGRIYVLSDDGGREINGVDCKELPAQEQRFRAITVNP